jgi:hypothetical protein
MLLALPDMSPSLRAGIDELSRASEHFLVVVHRYEMYLALARDLTFVTRINRTSCAAGWLEYHPRLNRCDTGGISGSIV